MIRPVLGSIFLYAVLLFVVLQFGGSYQFEPLTVLFPNEYSQFAFYCIMGIILWIVYDGLRVLIKRLSAPISRITFGLVHIIINAGVFYLVPVVTTFIDNRIQITLGTFIEVALLSLGLTFFGVLLKKL